MNQPEIPALPYQNTMEAFTAALDAGADGIELDVITSKDGKCFVIHDDDLSLHNAAGSISAMNSSDIKSKNIGLPQKYKIPSLIEVLELFKSRNKFLNIEIKQQGITEQVLAELKANSFPEENLLVSSFNFHDLVVLRDLNKAINIGLLFGKESRKHNYFESYIMDVAEKLVPVSFNMEKTLSYLSVLESKNPKYFWTIRKEDMDNFLVEGLSMYENVNFITDYPAEMVKRLRL